MSSSFVYLKFTAMFICKVRMMLTTMMITHCALSHLASLSALEMIERQYETAADREQNKEREQWKEM